MLPPLAIPTSPLYDCGGSAPVPLVWESLLNLNT